MTTRLERDIEEVTDLRVLKQKRGTRKGTITRQANYLTTATAQPLERLKLSDITRRQESVSEAITEYDVIQSRIEEVDTEEGITAEEGEVDEQKRHNSELADSYYQLIDIIQAWKLGGKIKDDANDLSKVDSLLSTYNHPTYEQLVEEYKSFREAVRTYPERKELSGLKDEVAPLVTQLTAKANLECTEAGGGMPAPSRTSSGATTPPLPPAEPTYCSQLKLELPSFSGDLLEWRHLFSARIERETGLSECEKIGCLESAMSSAEAKDIVRHASITGKYDDVVAELKGHYDKVKLVNKHHVNQLLSLSPVGDDHESLVLFKRTLNQHIGGIQACRGDSFEQHLLRLCLVVTVCSYGQSSSQISASLLLYQHFCVSSTDVSMRLKLERTRIDVPTLFQLHPRLRQLPSPSQGSCI